MKISLFDDTDKSAIVSLVAGFSVDATEMFVPILDALGAKTIAYLRSLTSEVRPPARKPTGGTTGQRPAHPGHWADITGDLARGYSYRVDREPLSVVLVLANDVEYAIYLEEHEGFFVLNGVLDDNGPVVDALSWAVRQVAPDWQVRVA